MSSRIYFQKATSIKNLVSQKQAVKQYSCVQIGTTGVVVATTRIKRSYNGRMEGRKSKLNTTP